MTKQEYMEQLSTKLKKLPKDDFTKAIEYYEEYFADAGEENEAQAIEDLGSPQMAADQIIREFAIDNSNSGEAKKDVKKGLNGVWIVILAIFASPIALPFVLVIVTLLFSFLIVVFSLLLAFGITGVALVISAPVTLIGAFYMLLKSIPVALVCLGMSLLCASLGILIVYATFIMTRKFLYWIILVFGKKFANGKKNNNDQKDAKSE